MNPYWLLLGLALITVLGAVLYWLIIITEGVYLGPRMVVWLYDRTAVRYDDIKQFDPDTERAFVIYPLLNELSAEPAPLVLDVASGTGRLPAFLLDEPTFNGRVIALDASAPMLGQAKPKLSPFRNRAMLVQGTAVRLPYRDTSFHAVTCLEALEFFPDEDTALREMARVLRPGGVLLTTRRCGWEAQTFVGRYTSKEQFAAGLEALGFGSIDIRLWQVEYDLVLARKA